MATAVRCKWRRAETLVDVPPGYSARRAISERFGIPLDRMKLVLRGKPLRDDASVLVAANAGGLVQVLGTPAAQQLDANAGIAASATGILRRSCHRFRSRSPLADRALALSVAGLCCVDRMGHALALRVRFPGVALPDRGQQRGHAAACRGQPCGPDGHFGGQRPIGGASGLSNAGSHAPPGQSGQKRLRGLTYIAQTGSVEARKDVGAGDPSILLRLPCNTESANGVSFLVERSEVHGRRSRGHCPSACFLHTVNAVRVCGIEKLLIFVFNPLHRPCQPTRFLPRHLERTFLLLSYSAVSAVQYLSCSSSICRCVGSCTIFPGWPWTAGMGAPTTTWRGIRFGRKPNT